MAPVAGRVGIFAANRFWIPLDPERWCSAAIAQRKPPQWQISDKRARRKGRLDMTQTAVIPVPAGAHATI
jgi:hypothetical protein